MRNSESCRMLHRCIGLIPMSVAVSLAMFLALASLTSGCSRPEPHNPAAHGRDRALFLSRHGDQLTPYQASLIRKLPLSSRQEQQGQMLGILQGAGAASANGSSRRSVLGLQGQAFRAKKGVRVIDLGPVDGAKPRPGGDPDPSGSGEREPKTDSGEDDSL